MDDIWNGMVRTELNNQLLNSMCSLYAFGWTPLYICIKDCLYGKVVVTEDDEDCHACSMNATNPSIPVSVTGNS